MTYHSCRNRHCPKCQTLTKERWVAARRADLLPIPYFHVVFTLPHDLNALAQGHPRVIYTLLFRAAADTLLTFGRDARHLGGTIGITAILHTWGQNLSQHLHLHCLVTGGALAADGTRWIAGHVVPVSGPRVIDGFSCEISCRLSARLRRQPADPDRRPRGSLQPLGRDRPLAPATGRRLDRLCEAALRRSGAGPQLSGAVHPPRRVVE
jgi:Transposase zinc-binding domain/Putative transposase